MELNNLSPNLGTKTKRNRVGRGRASGSGKTSGRGHDGQMSRSGGRSARGFEGGQMPIYRRLPKRGFTNIRFKKDIVAINIDKLNVFNDKDTVDIEALKSKGLISKERDGVKILGNGELEKNLTVKVHYFSETAKEKIQAKGGKIEVI